jgi:hypothetical protein
VLTVSGDRDLVERQLRDGLLRCPRCAVGVLGGHGRVPSRWLRRVDGSVVLFKAGASAEEKAGGRVAEGLRRGRCKAGGCGATHVLAPPGMLARRLDEVEVAGVVCQARAEGAGYRQIVGRLGRVAAGVVGLAAEVGVVRRCAGRLAANAEVLRAGFTRLAHRVDPSPPVMTAGRGAVAEAVAAIGEAVAAARRLLGAGMLALSPWEVAAAVAGGGLLAAAPKDHFDGFFSTSRHLTVPG